MYLLRALFDWKVWQKKSPDSELIASKGIHRKNLTYECTEMWLNALELCKHCSESSEKILTKFWRNTA